MSNKHHTNNQHQQSNTHNTRRGQNTSQEGTHSFEGVTYTYKEISKTLNLRKFALYEGDNEIDPVYVENNTTIGEAIDRAITARKAAQQRLQGGEPTTSIIDTLIDTININRTSKATEEVLFEYENLINNEGEILKYIQLLEEKIAFYGPLETPVSLEIQLHDYKKKLKILRSEIEYLEEELEIARWEFNNRASQNMPDIERKMRQTRIRHLESEIGHKRKLADIYQNHIRTIELYRAENSNVLSLSTESLYTLTQLELEQVQKDLEQIQAQIEAIESKFGLI